MISFLMHHRIKLSWATVVVNPLNSMRSVRQNGSKYFFEYPTRLDLYATCTGNFPFGVSYMTHCCFACTVMYHSRFRRDGADECVKMFFNCSKCSGKS